MTRTDSPTPARPDSGPATPAPGGQPSDPTLLTLATVPSGSSAGSAGSGSGAAGPGSSPGTPVDPAPPAELPGYRIERRLGFGAFGSVWLAVQATTGKRVAIKFFTDSGRLNLPVMRSEVDKLAALYTERDIVQLIDVGWEHSPPYFVMEYLERGSLEEHLKAGPLPVPEALRIFREVAGALSHAHGRGVLHCDLKPANVLLDADLRARLADFGQSRGVHDSDGSLGTFFYMAPEQSDPDAAPDARWDVYALGAMLYCCLTGSPPYRTPETRKRLGEAEDLSDRLQRYRRLFKDLPRPSAHRKVPGMDRALADIIDRCLEPRPSRRLPNVQAVLSALDAREARRARRPLLIMGAAGPAALLLLMSLFAMAAFNDAVGRSTDAVVDRAQESVRFAAQFAGETAAREIEHRWHVLERAAGDPVLVALLSAAEPRPRGGDAAEFRPFQQWLEDTAAEHREIEVASWFLTDRTGRHLARVGEGGPTTAGQNFRYRDYFHGRGRDFDPKAAPDDLEPVRTPHRSTVYRSTVTGRRMVAFSVPVWSGRAGGADRRVIGVLAVTVQLGRFGELAGDDAHSPTESVMLVDTRPDWTGRPGLVLQHPVLTALDAVDDPLPEIRIDDQTLGRFLRLQEAGARPSAELTRHRAFADPAAPDAGPHVAGFEPVVVRGIRTGWVVVVQEPVANVVGPVDDLRRRLLITGVLAVGSATLVLTAVWAMVMRWVTNAPLQPGGAHGRGPADGSSGTLSVSGSSPSAGSAPQSGSISRDPDRSAGG